MKRFRLLTIGDLYSLKESVNLRLNQFISDGLIYIKSDSLGAVHAWAKDRNDVLVYNAYGYNGDYMQSFVAFETDEALMMFKLRWFNV